MSRPPNNTPNLYGFFPAAPASSSQASSRQNLPPPPPPPPPPAGSAIHQPQFMYNYSNAPQQYQYRNPNPQLSNQQPMIPPPVLAGMKRPREEIKVPESQWKCEPCKLSFDSESALKAHTASHETCTACSFVGAPKVVKGHFLAVHGRFSGSGFKSVTVAVPGCPVQRFRICVGSRPEDLEKWIAERRKRFPRKVKQQEATPKEEKKGLSSLLDGYGSSSSEDEKPANDKKEEAAPVPEAQHAKPTSTNSSRRPCRYFMRNGTCRNGDQCGFSHDVADRSKKSNNTKFPNKGRIKDPGSLLRKLFENDVRRETVLTLQLLEYIVDTDFLQKPKVDDAK